MPPALALALTPTESTAHPSAPREVRLVSDLVTLARQTLDHHQTLACEPDLVRDQQALAAVRGAREVLRALRELPVRLPGSLSASLAAEVEVLDDRAQELVDTLLWATEGAEMLREVIEDETCASPAS